MASSCSERIDINLDSQSGKLVVNAFISTEPSQQTVWLSQSSPYFAGLSAVQHITGASVWINDERLTPNDTAPGQYLTRTDFSVAEGALAQLRVEYDFNGDGEPEVFTAEETMPHNVQLDEIRIAPIMDTSRYVSPFGIAAVFHRNMADECFSGDFLYCASDGRRHNMSRYIGDYGADNIPYGTFDERAIFTFMIGGDTILQDNGDTLSMCPFDTVLMRINSLPKFTLTYLHAAVSEAYGSNPMFGGPPANVPTNIKGDNVIGCLALRNPSGWKSVTLPMNLKTLDGTWVAQDGSGTKITIDENGTATYANGEKKGEIYFEGVVIDAGIRGFYEPSNSTALVALPLRKFQMMSYREFVEKVNPDDSDTWITWRRERRSFF